MTSLLVDAVITYFRFTCVYFPKKSSFKTQLLLNDKKLFSSVFEFGKIILFNIFPVLGSGDITNRHILLKMLKILRKSSICHL